MAAVCTDRALQQDPENYIRGVPAAAHFTLQLQQVHGALQWTLHALLRMLQTQCGS